MPEYTEEPGSTDTMKAIAINRFGGIEELELQMVPVPEIAPDEVLIHIHTAGVGVWDPAEREGLFAEMRGEDDPDFPQILGREAAGTVISTGEKVTNVKKEDKVYANGSPDPEANLYAEYAAVKAKDVVPVPENLSVEEAGVMPVDAITALTGLDQVLKLKNDESLIIFGASGGIGHLAVQLAKLMGARIFAVASGGDGVNFTKKLGADTAVDGRNKNITEAAREFAPDGFDAALLTAGGNAAEQVLKTVRNGGRAAYPYGVNPEPKTLNGIDVQAYNMKSSPEVYKKLNSLIEAGPFTVHIDRTFPLEEAANAHRQLGEHYLGKFALKVG